MYKDQGEDVRITYDSIEAQTERAKLFVIGDLKLWLPLSKIRVYEQNNAIHIPEWLAKEKGLI